MTRELKMLWKIQIDNGNGIFNEMDDKTINSE